VKQEFTVRPLKRTFPSPYSKEMERFIKKIGKLAEQGKLNYEQDPFWAIVPQKLGKTDSSKLDAIMYRKP
jgi:hypothetical protein